MNNRELRLLTDVIKQQHKVVNKSKIRKLILDEFHISVSLDDIKNIPSFKQVLLKEVIVDTQGGPRLKKVVKNRFRANVRK